MKILLCSNIQLGVVCTENLDLKQAHKWQKARNEKFSDMIDKAAQNHAEYVILTGQFFGQKRIPESLLDEFFQSIKKYIDIQLLAILNDDEFKRIMYRSDIPENLHLLCPQRQESYSDEKIEVIVDNSEMKIQLGNHTSLFVKKNEKSFILSGIDKNNYVVPSFEPIGFEDFEENNFGYYIVDCSHDKSVSISFNEFQKYAFQSIELEINEGDDQKEIQSKINNAIKEIEFDSFLHITIKGRLAFGLTINSEALEHLLENRFFYVEVYDSTVMDIDESAFENDISLRAEFVKLALRDASLSESERSRLISCGWNALNGGR